jgi:hypothetical protein
MVVEMHLRGKVLDDIYVQRETGRRREKVTEDRQNDRQRERGNGERCGV